MHTLELTTDNLNFLEAALEKALDNEVEAEYYEQYVVLLDIVRAKFEAIEQ